MCVYCKVYVLPIPNSFFQTLLFYCTRDLKLEQQVFCLMNIIPSRNAKRRARDFWQQGQHWSSLSFGLLAHGIPRRCWLYVGIYGIYIYTFCPRTPILIMVAVKIKTGTVDPKHLTWTISTHNIPFCFADKFKSIHIYI